MIKDIPLAIIDANLYCDGARGRKSMRRIFRKYRLAGFTLIEILIFVAITGILASTILNALIQLTRKTPSMLYQAVALQTARQCIDWIVGQKNLNGYTSITCPSSAVPSFCSVPTGYSLSISVSCTTINSDANYKTVTATVTGNGYASLTTLLANY